MVYKKTQNTVRRVLHITYLYMLVLHNILNGAAWSRWSSWSRWNLSYYVHSVLAARGSRAKEEMELDAKTKRFRRRWSQPETKEKYLGRYWSGQALTKQETPTKRWKKWPILSDVEAMQALRRKWSEDFEFMSHPANKKKWVCDLFHSFLLCKTNAEVLM